jgi:hypothetical protein
VKHTNTGKNIPNDHEVSQIATKYTKWTENLPNNHKIYQHLPLQCPPIYPNWDFWFENKPCGNPDEVFVHVISPNLASLLLVIFWMTGFYSIHWTAMKP